MSIKLSYLLLIIAGWLFANHAQMKKVQDFYLSSPGFEVQFEQSAGGNKMAAGKLYIKKGGKMRVELKNLIMATDGKSTWNYQKSAKKLIISEYDENDASMLSFNRVVFDYPSKCNIKESVEGGKKVYSLTPKSKMSFSSMRCVVNADYSVEKMDITDNAGHVITLQFTSWKFSAPQDSLFSIEPAKGVKVIDLRQ